MPFPSPCPALQADHSDYIDLLRKLREAALIQRTPVILITSLSDLESEERGLALGAVDYIRKPFRDAIIGPG